MIIFNLKNLMKSRGITLRELASKTDLSINTLSLLSTGKSKGIQFDTLEKIINALNCNVEDIILTSDNFNSLEIISTEVINKNLDILNKLIGEEYLSDQTLIECVYKNTENIQEKLILTINDFTKSKIINISGNFPTNTLTSGKTMADVFENYSSENPTLNNKVDIFDVFMCLIFKKMIQENLYEYIYDHNNNKEIYINYIPYSSITSSPMAIEELSKVSPKKIDNVIKNYNVLSDYWTIDGYKLSISYDFYKEV